MIFVDTIHLNARLFPNRPALMMADRLVTYQMLSDAIHWLSARLHQAGLRSGDMVLVDIENPVRHVTLVSALMNLGIVSMTGSGQIAQVPKVGITTVLASRAMDVPRGMRMVVVDDGWFQPPQDATYPSDPASRDPRRLILFGLTSGTTGEPKAIPFTIGEFDLRLRNLMLYHGAPGTERDLVLIGFASQWALSETARALASARTVCLARTAEEAVRLVDQYQVGVILGSPQQFAGLLAALRDTPVSCASVRLASVAGAMLGAELGAAIRRRIAPQVLVGYGSTEAGKTAMAHLDSVETIPGAVGHVVPSARLEIVDGDDRPVPAGTVGRIRIMAAGGGRPYEPGTLFPDRTPDWFYPGDLGHLTADGMLVVVGRSDDLINAGGLKIAPERVEELVAGHPAIAEAVAFALPGATGIDEIWLAVVARQPVSAETIIAHCRSRSETLAPRRILFLEAMPRAALGKPDRIRLRALASR
ncbi:class I adenylate-forming enzyme family protein [Phreatobacter sp.]|uniref:class I adenylate-forming enzyme family protein n=1 Tax=Phreatobacter sp. TaxID=1966341 RepID=UPI0022BA7D38|nr:class I adenylate-forming enzyme family protein [Phreatobacter sp.]MCZ8313699.1 class I adenylate-forming enzyme family protein [Phreatobacter sp.]